MEILLYVALFELFLIVVIFILLADQNKRHQKLHDAYVEDTDLIYSFLGKIKTIFRIQKHPHNKHITHSEELDKLQAVVDTFLAKEGLVIAETEYSKLSPGTLKTKAFELKKIKKSKK